MEGTPCSRAPEFQRTHVPAPFPRSIRPRTSFLPSHGQGSMVEMVTLECSKTCWAWTTRSEWRSPNAKEHSGNPLSPEETTPCCHSEEIVEDGMRWVLCAFLLYGRVFYVGVASTPTHPCKMQGKAPGNGAFSNFHRIIHSFMPSITMSFGIASWREFRSCRILPLDEDPLCLGD